MILWRLIPFVRIASAFILGILMERFLPGCNFVLLIISIAIFIYGWYRDYISTNTDVAYPFYAGFLLMLLFFNLGYIRSQSNDPSLDPNHYMYFADQGTYAIGVVQEIPMKRTSYRTEVEIEYICNKTQNCTKVKSKAIVYFNKNDEKAAAYKPGDRIVFKSKLEKVKKSTNPYSFDFHSYLWNRGITHQTFIWKSINHNLVAHGKLNFLMQLAMDSRSSFLKIFDKYIKDHDQNSIVSAMVLGYRNTVSEEMYKAFSDSGSVHILAVSGMHLVFLVALLQWIYLVIKLKNRKLKLAISITLIWFFSLVTGAAPAIIRAAIMFTFILFGRAYKIFHNMYNILAFCALIMLTYDPFLIYQASFQFSFAALLSLAYFEPYVKSWFSPESSLLQKIWAYTSVAIAAQILVIPITIFFFHKVPTYFILSGLLPVVLSNIAMNISIALIVVEKIPFMIWLNTYIIAPVLKLCLYLFIQSVVLIKKLPLNSINGLTLSYLEFVLFVFFLIVLMLYLSDRKVQYIYGMSLMLIVFLLSITDRLHKANHQSVVTIYDVNKSGMIDFFDGRKVYNLQFDSLPTNQLQFINQNNRYYHFVRDTFNINMDIDFCHERIQKTKNIIQFKKMKMAILFKQEHLCFDYSMCEYIVLMSNLSFDKCLKTNKNQVLIIDKSVKYNNLVEWNAAYTSNHLTVKTIKNTGAITINI